jgi:hypothetical protein
MKKLESIQDKLCIATVFVVFIIIDLYILIKGHLIVYKEKYIDSK